MNSKQIILVLESKSHNDSDYMYVRTFIRKQLKDKTNIKNTSLPMNGKDNYNSKSLQSRIKQEIKKYKHGKSVVLIGYDTDNIDMVSKDDLYDKRITEFCKLKGYYPVFFCRDVEEVFLGKRISKNKTKEAIRFLRSGGIDKIKTENFYSENKRIGKSNLCLVLERVLQE